MLHFLEWDPLITREDGTLCSPVFGRFAWQSEDTHSDVNAPAGVPEFETTHLWWSQNRRETPEEWLVPKAHGCLGNVGDRPHRV